MIWIVAILAFIVYVLYLVIEFLAPILLIYLLLTNPSSPSFIVWAILLVTWFISRMIVYITKEIR